jgi:hypothetical protein
MRAEYGIAHLELLNFRTNSADNACDVGTEHHGLPRSDFGAHWNSAEHAPFHHVNIVTINCGGEDLDLDFFGFGGGGLDINVAKGRGCASQLNWRVDGKSVHSGSLLSIGISNPLFKSAVPPSTAETGSTRLKIEVRLNLQAGRRCDPERAGPGRRGGGAYFD